MVSAMAEPAPPAEIAAAVADAIERHAHRAGALLPLLHAVHDRLGYLPAECEAPIARALNLSRAEVHGVIGFYHHFRSEPPRKPVLQLCQAEACRSMGCQPLLAHAQRTLGDCFEVEPVYCLGQCANAPSALIGERVVARLTPARLDEIVASLRATEHT
jgi:formate dehydrogenase subunit gamma